MRKINQPQSPYSQDHAWNAWLEKVQKGIVQPAPKRRRLSLRSSHCELITSLDPSKGFRIPWCWFYPSSGPVSLVLVCPSSELSPGCLLCWHSTLLLRNTCCQICTSNLRDAQKSSSHFSLWDIPWSWIPNILAGSTAADGCDPASLFHLWSLLLSTCTGPW